MRIRYLDTGGSGFPLLIIPGGGLNSSITGLITSHPFNAIDDFKGEFRCVTADLRTAYAGESSGPLEADRPWDAFTDDHIGVMDHLGIDRFMVLGFCIGGPFIWNLIERAPSRVVAAVTAQPSGYRPEQPTLFIEFHGSEKGVEEQVELVKMIAAEYGSGEFRWSVKPEERTKLWQARHDAYYAGLSLRAGSRGWPTDVCVPISRLAECIAGAREDAAKAPFPTMVVGHVGDGYFHLPMLVDGDNPVEIAATKALNDRVVRRALAMDVSRDLRAVRRAAGRRGLSVAFAADTHLHADFLSGAVQLGHDDGATVLASAAGHRAFAHTPLADEDEVDLLGDRGGCNPPERRFQVLVRPGEFLQVGDPPFSFLGSLPPGVGLFGLPGESGLQVIGPETESPYPLLERLVGLHTLYGSFVLVCIRRERWLVRWLRYSRHIPDRKRHPRRE